MRKKSRAGNGTARAKGMRRGMETAGRRRGGVVATEQESARGGEVKTTGSRWAAMVGMVFLAGCAVGAEGARDGGRLPRMATRHGEYILGKKPYPAGTRERWIAEGRVLGEAPEGYLPSKRMPRGAADNRSYMPPIGDQGS